jgi:hypothetical protein
MHRGDFAMWSIDRTASTKAWVELVVFALSLLLGAACVADILNNYECKPIEMAPV